MGQHTVTINLTEDEHNRVQAQLENRKYLNNDEDITENEFLAKAVVSYSGLKETSKHYMDACATLDNRILSLERACNIHYTNMIGIKSVWCWIKWKFFNKTLVGDYDIKREI